MKRRVPSSRLAILCLVAVAAACSQAPVAGLPTPSPAGSSSLPPDPQREAFEALVRASSEEPELTIQHGFPVLVSADVPLRGESSGELALNFLSDYRDLYLLDTPDLELGVKKVAPGPPDIVTLYQTYRGVAIHGGELTVIVAEDGITTIGDLLTSDIDLETTPNITEADALELARHDLDDPDAYRAGPARLAIYDPSLFDDLAPRAHLVWQFRVFGAAPWEYLIDAHDGPILSATLLFETFDDWDFDLEDSNGNNALDTICYWWTAHDDEIGDSDGVYAGSAYVDQASAAWSAMRHSWAFYHDNFHRNSFDGDEGPMEFYVDADLPDNTIAANYSGSIFCDAIDYDTDDYPIVQGVVTHEFTHGVIAHSSELISAGQSYALNEGYSDIMGILDTHDWTFGGLVNESNLSKQFSQYDPAGDEHDNGRIFVTVFSKIVKGYDFLEVSSDGFGLDDSRIDALFYLTMVSLNSSAGFMDARNSTLYFAKNLGAFPFFSVPSFSTQEACEIQNAFYATGIGYPDLDCDGDNDAVADSDNDSIPNSLDNCPTIWNAGQQDFDKDGIGDACDQDLDGDQVPDSIDNCKGLYNPSQENKDLDNLGKACDPNEDEDFDDDGVLNEDDNCLFDENSDQADVDDDGAGDACDPDGDGDGISNDDDNCPFTPNSDQANTDGDGAGDACDPCPTDSDVIAWTAGNTELGIEPKPLVSDIDGDGIPDACDQVASLISTAWVDGIDELFPDGRELPAEVVGGPGRSISLPIPICPPLEDGAHAPEDRQSLRLRGLSDGVRAWVSDGGGDQAGSSPRPGDPRTINFSPQGGDTYWLNLLFAPDYPDGQFESFLIELLCDKPEPTPRNTPSATPTPGREGTPTATLRFTPTVYVRPTFTPTPGRPLPTAPPLVR